MDLSPPQATFRSYLAAVKANDLVAAKACWTIDDGDTAGALDVVIGQAVESRRLVAAVRKAFGDDGVKALGRWDRPACSDAAIDRTARRLADAEVKTADDVGRIKFAWSDDDTGANCFVYLKAAFGLRKINEAWRLDANVFAGSERAVDLFADGKIWPLCAKS